MHRALRGTHGQAAADRGWEWQNRNAPRRDGDRPRRSAARRRATRAAARRPPLLRSQPAAAAGSAPHSGVEAVSPETCRDTYHSWTSTRYDGWTGSFGREAVQDRLPRPRLEAT